MFGSFIGGFATMLGLYAGYRLIRSGFFGAIAEAWREGWKEEKEKSRINDEEEE